MNLQNQQKCNLGLVPPLNRHTSASKEHACYEPKLDSGNCTGHRRKFNVPVARVHRSMWVQSARRIHFPALALHGSPCSTHRRRERTSARRLDAFNATHLSGDLERDTTAPVRALSAARVAADARGFMERGSREGLTS